MYKRCVAAEHYSSPPTPLHFYFRFRRDRQLAPMPPSLPLWENEGFAHPACVFG